MAPCQSETVSRDAPEPYGRRSTAGSPRSAFTERTHLSFTPLALGYAVALATGLPLLAFRTGLREEHVEEVTAARSAVYFSAAVSILVLTAVTFGISAWQGIPPSDLGWRVEDPGPAFTWAVAAAAGGLAAVWLVVRLGQAIELFYIESLAQAARPVPERNLAIGLQSQ